MRMNGSRAVPLSLGGMLVACAFLAWSLALPPEGDPPTDPGPPAVQASGAEFRTVEGTTESLSDYRGGVVVLNLWGTWCPPCIREIPHLVEVQEVIGPRGGTVIGLAVDSGASEEVLAFWSDRLELDPTYPLWLGTNREARAHFEAFGLPNTLIIDEDGMIRERLLGLVTRDQLLERVEPLLR